MNDRTKTGIVLVILALFFLLPAAFFSQIIIVAGVIVTILTCLEMFYALRRRLKPISLTSIFIGAFTALLPLFVWLAFSDYVNWFNLPLRASGISAELVQNNLWRSYYLWLFGLGFAVYAFAFFIYALFSVLWQFMHYGPIVLPQAGLTVFAALYLSLPLASLALLSFAIPNGYKWVWFAVIVVTTTDIAAYYGGKNFGKNKIVPDISPNKTIEGTISGLLASAVVGSLYALLFLTGSVPQLSSYFLNFIIGFCAAFILSILAQLGDWFASALKRWVKLKDFSKILPGHGGVLDRIDSYMFVLPGLLLLTFVYYMSKFA
ncbi:phosphatidate cytidylyltransferase [Amygdalobacter nucleatus]|uniref:Phosphatidate cytidylyltransferase n=1 Tax=Amygdalobacter nucleatus TaxID=3029274 RepID=A0A133YA69_9FIRM|nr:CDP-archaeol synthase [Amygdalobacter nucleatus]KXB40099.1 phosphatidate cytidylyltransferase [Amygdalobacter nucleatus]MDF0485856.1 CDP-archaeol synthase [Amygdalobacter nucleatus]WEG36312.1 CDP-archaeol synthase [Amygdalobacter nucleatus]